MTTNLTQEAYKHVRAKLMRGELIAGSKLSSLAVARELDISNMPVREALSQLHLEGLLDRKPNVGCVVRTFDESELEELYVLRELLESFAAMQCARHISRQDLGTLEDICAEMRWIADDARTVAPENAKDIFHAISETDIHFHQTLLAAAGNRWVAKAAENVLPISQMMHAQRLPTDANPRWASARHYRIHHSILQIIRNGDPEQARTVMEAHIRCGNPLYEVKRLKFPGGMDSRLKREKSRRPKTRRYKTT